MQRKAGLGTAAAAPGLAHVRRLLRVRFEHKLRRVAHERRVVAGQELVVQQARASIGKVPGRIQMPLAGDVRERERAPVGGPAPVDDLQRVAPALADRPRVLRREPAPQETLTLSTGRPGDGGGSLGTPTHL